MARPNACSLPVVLFGYDVSVFTQKIQLALRMKQIPYTFVQVPSMLPRPILRDNFAITYRKIPILAVGKEFYIDTSLIIEALEHHYSPTRGYGTLYPPTSSGRTYQPLIRGFASYWTDRPLFRLMTGLIPGAVWRSAFGKDREGLIGHAIDPDKLEKKIPQNLSGVDLQLSILEPLFTGASEAAPWIFDTVTPSHADLALFYQLDWGEKIGRGEGIESLTAGEAKEGQGEGSQVVFNARRYPGIHRWFERMKQYVDGQPPTETRIEPDQQANLEAILAQIRSTELGAIPLLETAAPQLQELDDRIGLKSGAHISVTPDDTGRGDPSFGKLIALSPEEIVLSPDRLDGKEPRVGELRLHFPRLGFIAKPAPVAAVL